MSNFILRQKIVDAIHHIFPIIERFPKYEKFALISQIKNVMFNMLKLSIGIQSSRDKQTALRELDIEIDFLKELLAYSNDKKGFRYLSDKSRKSSLEKVIEIGKITGGLIRSNKG